MKRALGFYRDRKGRIRPITPRLKALPPREVMYPIPERQGYWIRMNGQRVLLPNYQLPKVKESDIPEEERVNIDEWIGSEKDKKEARDRIIFHLENQVRMLFQEYLQARTGEQRSEILKKISYDQDKIKEVLDYNHPTRRKMSPGHLYRNGAQNRERKSFEKAYGVKKGDYIYGATVGKVRREREAGSHHKRR